jgi:hypothetical protein
MSKKLFDVSKLTPLPDYTITVLNQSRQRQTQPSQTTQITSPILSPLPPLPNTVTSPTVSPPITSLTPLQPLNALNNKTGVITLPDIPQTTTHTPPTQPTLTNITDLPTKIYNGPVVGSRAVLSIPNIPVATIVQGSPDKQEQFTRELHFAPLSPRNPRITRNETVTLVTHATKPTTTETCCICYDEEIPSTNLLACEHPVCGECTAQLQTAECPMCKTFLEGPLVTDEILANILNRQEQNRLNEMTANYMAGLYLEQNPDADPEEVYRRYRN